MVRPNRLNQTKSGFYWSIHISWQSSLSSFNDRLEGFNVANSELSQSAAIQFDASQTQALNESVVGDSFCANCSVNTLNPQLAEVALASLAVAEVVSK